MWRTGDYATTLWHHRLACGHVEARKRRAPATEIGCLRCEAADAVAGQAVPSGTSGPELNGEADVATLRVRLAASLDVPVDSVTLQYSGGRIAGALVFLDALQVSDRASN